MPRPVNPHLLDLIRELASDDRLEEDTPLYGIAMKVAFQGIHELTTGQAAVFKRRILPLLESLEPYIEYE